VKCPITTVSRCKIKLARAKGKLFLFQRGSYSCRGTIRSTYRSISRIACPDEYERLEANWKFDIDEAKVALDQSSIPEYTTRLQPRAQRKKFPEQPGELCTFLELYDLLSTYTTYLQTPVIPTLDRIYFMNKSRGDSAIVFCHWHSRHEGGRNVAIRHDSQRWISAVTSWDSDSFLVVLSRGILADFSR